MPRHGYLIIPETHRLFPNVAAREVEARAESIILALSSQQPEIPLVKFKIKQFALGGLSESKVVDTLFSSGPLPDLRLVFSRRALPPRKMKTAMAGSKLCILIVENEQEAKNTVRGSSREIHSSFVVQERNSERIIEDIIIDVTLGNFFSKTDVIGSIIKASGLNGLYRKKVEFARRILPSGWLDKITKQSRYVTLSSLDNVPSTDIRLRGKAAYSRWLEFIQWLEPQIRQPSAKTNDAISKLKLAPKLGGQLPLLKIEKAISKLPDGKYALIILTSGASAGKSPSFRGKIRSIFHGSPRRNSFVIMTYADYHLRCDNILPLIKSHHIVNFTVEISPQTITIVGR